MVPSENLEFGVEIDVKRGKRGVDELNESLSKNTEQTKKIQAELRRLEKEYKSIATAIKKLPKDQLGKLSKEVEKADDATRELSFQLERTASKMDRVADRTSYAEEAMGGLAAATATAVLWFSRVKVLTTVAATLATFSNQIMHASQAFTSFVESIHPFVRTTKHLFTSAFEKLGQAALKFGASLGIVGGAIVEQIQRWRGFHVVMIRTGQILSGDLVRTFTSAVIALGSGASRLERAFRGILEFVASAQAGVSRIKRVFTTVGEAATATGRIISSFSKGLSSTFGADSVGAARINPWTKLFLDIQAAASGAFKATKSMLSGIAGIVASFKPVMVNLANTILVGTSVAIGTGLGKLHAAFMNSFDGAKTLFVALDRLALKGFNAFISGAKSAATAAINWGSASGFLSKGIFGVIEAGNLFGATMLLLGTKMKESENAIVSAAGSFLQFASIISISFSSAVTLALGVVGGFLDSIGTKLLQVMGTWEEKFREAQDTLTMFQFSIKGFAKTFGEDAVGSLETWGNTVREMTQTTTFGFKEIQKSIKLLITEGQALGLSYEDNLKVLKASADLASASGSRLEDTSLAVVKAMGGMGASLQSLGVFTTNAALAHSNLVAQQNINIDTLNTHEKAQLVLNSILEQTAPIAGAASEGLKTITGASTQLTRSLEEAQSKLGVQNSLYADFIRLVNGLVQAFNSLSPEFFLFISGTVDALGVTFKLVGTLTTLSITLIGITSIYKMLNTFVKTSLFLQSALTIAFGALGSAVGVNVGAIQSLNAALLTSVKLILPSVIASINILVKIAFGAAATVRGLAASLLLTKAGWLAIIGGAVAATKAVVGFTSAILLNPLFLKGAFIVAGFLAVVQALSQMRKEMSALSQDIAETSEEIGVFTASFKAVADAAKSVGDVAIRAAKVALAGWAKLITLLQISVKGWGLLKDKVTGNAAGFEMISGEIDQLAARMENLDTVIDKAIGGNVEEKVAVFSAAIKKASLSIKGFSDSLKLSSEAAESLRIDVLGDEFDKANQKFGEAVKLLNNIRDQGVIKVGAEVLMPTTENLAKFVSGALDTKDAKAFIAPDTKELEKAMVEAEKARLELLKLRKDSLTEVSKLEKDVALRGLENAGKEIEAIKARGAAELADFRTKIERTKTVAGFSKEELRSIMRVESGIKAATEAEVARKKASLDDETAKKLKEQADNLERLRSEILGLKKDTLAESGNLIGAARVELELENQKIQKLQEALRAQKEFTDGAGNLKREYQDIVDTAFDLAEVTFTDIVDSQSFASKVSKALDEADVSSFTGKIAAGVVTGTLSSAKSIGEFLEGVEIGDVASWQTAVADAFDSLDPAELFAGATTALSEGMGSLFSGVADLFSPDSVMALTDTADAIADLPDALIAAFGKLDSMLLAFVDKFPAAFNRILEKLPSLIGSLLDKLPAVFAVLMESLLRIVEMLPDIIDAILAKLPDILEQILSRLPQLIEAIFKSLGNIFASILQRLPDILVKIMEHIPDIVESFIVGMADSIDRVVIAFVNFLTSGGLEKIVVALIKMIPRVALAMAVGFTKAIVNSLKRLFTGMPVPEELTKLPEKFSQGLADLSKKTTEEASKLFKVLDMEQAARGLDQAQNIEDALDRGIDKFNISFKGLITLLLETWNTIKEGILFALGGWLIELNRVMFEAVMGAWNWVVENILTPLANVVQTAFQWVVDNIILPLANAVQTAFSWVVTNVINPLLNVGSQIWEALKSGLSNAGSLFSDFGTQIWNGLKAGLDGLQAFFTNMFNNLNPSSLLSKVFAVPGDAWGKGTVEKTLGIDIPFMKFARGGLIPGSATVNGDSELNDKILALMSPGEAVIPRSKMQIPWIAEIVDDILSGKLAPPKFAMGGVLGSLVDGGASFLGSLSESAKTAFSSLGAAGTTIYKSISKTSFDNLVAAVSGGLDIKTSSPADLLSAVGSFADTQKILTALGKTVSGDAASTLKTIWDKVQSSGKVGGQLLKAVSSGDLWKLAKEHAFASVLRSFEANKFHSGGLIPAFAGGGEVPMLGQSGEFVLNRAATASLGVGALNALNSGRGSVGTQNYTFNIEIDLETSGNVDEAFIRQRVVPAVKKELKEASLKGDFILSERGIRKP